MIFRQLFDQETWTYTYLLADEASAEAVLIDSVDTQVERDIDLLDELGLTLKYCLETHVHADHITGADELRKRTGCQTAVSAHGNVSCADLHLKEGDVIKIGEIEIQVFETPGHTNTCISYYTHGMVFSGDTLLIRGCGRTDFQSGNSGQLYDSIMNKIFVLPENTLVFPGHDYRGFSMSTIKEEKLYNPRLKLSRDEFIEHMDGLVLDNPRKMDVAVPANLLCGKGGG